MVCFVDFELDKYLEQKTLKTRPVHEIPGKIEKRLLRKNNFLFFLYLNQVKYKLSGELKN